MAYGNNNGGGQNNPITSINLNAVPGEFVYQHNNQPYIGPYHRHKNGTFMIGNGSMGVNHEIIVGGTTPVELEGGEYIINGQTTAALGIEFLDKLNSTNTDYHTGGFGQGQLPNPSQFQLGGKVNYQSLRGKKMQNGGNLMNTRKRVPIQRRQLQEGTITCPNGSILQNGACYQMNGNPASTSGGYSNPVYKTGGNVKKMQNGGNVSLPNSSQNKKIRQSRNARLRVGRNFASRSTSVSMGHSHTMIVDVNGDGHTSEVLGHTHKISNNIVGIASTSNGKLHSH